MRRFLRKLFKPGYGTDSISVGSGRRKRSSALASLFQPLKNGLYNLQSSGWKSDQASATSPPRIRKLSRKDFLNPLNWIRWVIDFFFRWFMTRPALEILPAVPAMIATAALLALTVDQSRLGNSRRQLNYSAKLNSSLAKNDLQETALVIRSLLDLQPDRQDLLIQHAVVQEHLGHRDLAVQQMQELVHNSRNGQAAFWLVLKEFPLEGLADWDADRHAEFRSLMEVALETGTGSDSKERHLSMAKYLAATNAPGEALVHLEKLLPKHADQALSAAILCRMLGREDQAKTHAATAIEYLRSRLQVDPSNLVSRADLARAYMLRESEEDAIRVLRDGLQAGGESPELRALLSEILVVWSVRIKRESKGNDEQSATIGKRLGLITESLVLSPNHPLAIDAIIEIAIECRYSKEAAVRSLLMESLNGLDPGILHFIRGTIATLEGDMKKAETHLRLAAEMGEAMPGLLNNLAVSLHSKEGGDLQQALRFAELALNQIPEHPYFLETRGQILAKMGRMEDAVSDLEKALKQKELASLILPTLIDCYRQLGLDDMASIYSDRLRHTK